MLSKIDRQIEKLFKRLLHPQKDYFIQRALNEYIAKYQPDEATISVLRKRLEDESRRIYPIVDRSILRERIQRAKYTFWITAITSLIISSVIALITGGILLPIIVPIATACISWLIAIGTLPIAYNQRIKGAMDSTIQVFANIFNPASDNPNPQQMQQQIKQLNSSVANLLEALAENNLSLAPNQNNPHLLEDIKLMRFQIIHLQQQLQVMNSEVHAPPSLSANEATIKESKRARVARHLHFWGRHKQQMQTKRDDGLLRFERI